MTFLLGVGALLVANHQRGRAGLLGLDAIRPGHP